MRLASDAASARSRSMAAAARARRSGSASRVSRHARTASEACRSTSASTVWIAVSRSAVSGLGSVVSKRLRPTIDRLARLDAAAALGVRGDERRLHVAGLDGGDRAAQLLDARHLGLGARDELGDLGLDDDRPGEEVVVLEQVGLVGEHLLHAQAPLLVPRPRQAERLVPRRQLDRAGARVLGERHGEHLEDDALDVVLGLRLGEAEAVDLHAVAEAPRLRVGDAVALAGQLVPQLDEGAHLAHLLDEAHAGVDEERDPGDDARRTPRVAPAPSRARRRAPRPRSTWRRRSPARASPRPPAGGSCRC